MTRFFNFPGAGAGADGEPARDERLGALLREVVGEPPMTDRDWSALADRVGAAVRAQHAAPWWSYVARWQRRALPLALAAGIVGGLAFWNAAAARPDIFASATGDPVSAVVAGASSDDAATSYAGSVASSADLVSAVPE